MRQLLAVTIDNPNRNAIEAGSYNRWNNQACSAIHRSTDPRHRFQSRGYHEQPHQSHMKGSRSIVNLGILCHGIGIIFARTEIKKMSKGKNSH
ncbi:hypothetical protein TNCV_4511941 [Trichonephila clavipes]|nr:hypothetical protein TNCV_4511941 [Trichonephila clavipes]